MGVLKMENSGAFSFGGLFVSLFKGKTKDGRPYFRYKLLIGESLLTFFAKEDFGKFNEHQKIFGTMNIDQKADKTSFVLESLVSA